MLPNGVLGSMGGGFSAESNLKKLFVAVCNGRLNMARCADKESANGSEIVSPVILEVLEILQ